ncbi:MAG: D-Ala-D-Ala carboxypeptidase family metallohydrolase [Deltaproteobacteria bacterium]|nr:D-Ala-D-Ala carboxypeptidase family metallohydrolase [Deltaproteobacteria bacterium]
MDLAAFALAVVAYRRGLNGTVTSWGRNAGDNKAVDGVPNSRHLYDLAADVVPGAGFTAERRRRYGHSLGLWVLVESDHDHLEPLSLRVP